MTCAGWLALVLLQAALVASQITVGIPSDGVPTFTDELREPKYFVGVLPEGSAPPSHVRTLTMTDVNGTRYSCFLPAAVEQEAGGGSSEVSPLLPQQTPEELLDTLREWCTYRVEDWWTYEVCYKRHVRQYHKEHKRLVAEFLLGRYSAGESDLNNVQTDTSDVSGSAKYVSQVYNNGDPCDLNDQQRSVEVRYVCNGGVSMDSVISSIQEPSSCSYLITISTPRLCKHPDFRSVPPPVSAIKCIPHPTEGGAGPAASGGRQAAAAAGAVAGGQVVALPGGAEGQCPAGGECGGAVAAAAGGRAATRQGRPGGSEAAEPPHAEPDVQQPANWTSPYDEEEVFLDAEEGWVEGMGGDAAMDPELYDAMYFAARDLGEEEDEYEDPDEGEEPAASGAAGQRDEL